MDQTISGLLYGPVPVNDPLLKVLIAVTISSNGNYAFSKYSNERGDFFTVDPKPHITIRYTPKEAPWEKHHQVVITQRNIFPLRLGFKKFYKLFQREDLYTYDAFGRISEIVADDKDIVLIPLGMNQVLRLAPTITTDRQNVLYPGVTLTVNREENQIDLSIDEFEGLYDLFDHIDIMQTGLTLLQTYIGMRKMSIEQTMDNLEKRTPPKTKKYSGTGSLFDQPSDGYVKTPPRWDIPKTLDDLNKEE